jgi:hypothetical protein
MFTDISGKQTDSIFRFEKQETRHKQNDLLAGCLFGSLLEPENGESVFLPNVGEILPSYTVL